MIVGVPKEIKNNEFRVGMTPSGANTFINNGHIVLIQKDAGLGSGYNDFDYSSVGAEICDTIEEIYEKSEMIVKLKNL
jgi:alanine dehydrogenase